MKKEVFITIYHKPPIAEKASIHTGLQSVRKQTKLRIKCMRNFVSLLFIEEFSHQFDMLLGHLSDGVAVAAVEVDKPVFCDDFSGLRLDEF